MSKPAWNAWNDINWTLVQKRLSRQQRRVYRASMEGKQATVHALQRRIIGSLDAKLLATKRVTTDNQGRNIVDVDGVKAISHTKKMELAHKLKLDGKASPIRRTYIPKPDKTQKRPLGISTIEDRAKQMLVKLALEPEWEAKFEPNSYGFRPGRSPHDAIASLFLSLRGKSRFVLDADLEKCFDRISHEKLLQKLTTFDQMENQIRAWLKTDIMVGYLNRPDEVFQSMEGTPQGGVISPLLSNIALHGLEEYIKNWYADDWYPMTDKSSKVAKYDRKASIGFSRYANNFVITAPALADIEAIQEQVSKWLDLNTGLELSKVKTKIVNSTKGFEFLGFRLISIKGQDTGQYKIKIHPSKTSKARIVQRIRRLIQENKSASSYTLINLLSKRIVGWSNYFQYSECFTDFAKLDYIIFQQIRAWVFRRKSKGLRGRTELKYKYFPEGNTYTFRGKSYKNNWILTGQSLIKDQLKENFLPKMVWVGSAQYVKIKGRMSPYDANHLYWAVRTERYSGFNHRVSKLLKRQNGR